MRKRIRDLTFKPRPLPKRITGKWLWYRGACLGGVRDFRSRFPKGIPLNTGGIRRAREAFGVKAVVMCLLLADKTRQGGAWVHDECLRRKSLGIFVWLSRCSHEEFLHFVKWCIQNERNDA